MIDPPATLPARRKSHMNEIERIQRIGDDLLEIRSINSIFAGWFLSALTAFKGIATAYEKTKQQYPDDKSPHFGLLVTKHAEELITMLKNGNWQNHREATALTYLIKKYADSISHEIEAAKVDTNLTAASAEACPSNPGYASTNLFFTGGSYSSDSSSSIGDSLGSHSSACISKRILGNDNHSTLNSNNLALENALGYRPGKQSI